MIKSATQYPVHTLLSHEGNLTYRVPAYQREYAWQKAQWEDLFQDLLEAEGAHFLGTIITINQSEDSVGAVVLEVIDGQQRLTTLTIFMAAIYAVIKENDDDLDDETRLDLMNLGRQLVRKDSGEPRLTPQTQGNNLADYRTVLGEAGLRIDYEKRNYFPSRRISKCFRYFRDAILRLAETEGIDEVQAAQKMLDAVQRSILVKIEVANHADAFVLFESLNNRGMPLTPVDLIKNHLLAESERKGQMKVDEAFKHWNEMLSNLGTNYANHERFLRHYYNAFKAELPEVTNAPVATRTNLIRIFETILREDIKSGVAELVAASSIYGRVTCVSESDEPTALDRSLGQLLRAQGSPSYVLVMWLLSKRNELGLEDAHVAQVVEQLTNFFVRRNLTGYPQTYGLPKLFMTIVERLGSLKSDAVVSAVGKELSEVSSPDEEFLRRLQGPIYDENSDVARFVLTTLSEDAMTKETSQDLWVQEKGHFVWTIEHIFPQGENIPKAWQDMLGGLDNAKAVQEADVHRLGNLTITAYNSNLGNKSFAEKRDRTDSAGRPIGYRNGLALNAGLELKDIWTQADIDHRTTELAEKVVARFPLF